MSKSLLLELQYRLRAGRVINHKAEDPSTPTVPLSSTLTPGDSLRGNV